jgi:diguanylate cyclase (GGDEF)-like protein
LDLALKIMGDVALGEFVVLALLIAVQWVRRRAPGVVWAMLAFVLLAAVSVAGEALRLGSPAKPWLLTDIYKAILCALFLVPYLFFRFAASFQRPRRAVEALASALTAAVIAWTLLLPWLPLPGAAPPPDYLAYRAVVASEWGLLFSFVALRLWRAGRGQSSGAAKRMRLLAAATAGLDIPVIVGALGLSQHPTVKLVTQALSLVMAALFLLALVLPSFVRSWWRKQEVDSFRAALSELVSMESADAVASRLLPHICSLVDATSVALFDEDGTVIARIDGGSAALSAGSDAITITPRLSRHYRLVLSTNPYMPYFGRYELAKIEALADLLGLAMDRCALAEREQVAMAALAHQATHDSLTGLPHRELFVERLAAALAPKPWDELHAVLFIDLDEFKLVNDLIDHGAGNTVLVATADRLREAMSGNDFVARLSGDEFAALIEVQGEDDALARAEALRHRLGVATSVGEREVSVTASIGVVVPAVGADPASALQQADMAMYHAKQGGRNLVQLFDDSIRHRARTQINLEQELRRAIEEHELRLQYQPIYRIADRSIVGVEALVRWDHPVRGLIGPDQFIPLAEQSGLIVPLGSFVLDETCRQTAAWLALDLELDEFTAWVNLSAGQFHRTEVVRSITDALSRSGLESRRLGVEITETVFMSDTARLRKSMVELKAQGISISLDDFGTGFSSLGYLQRFPVDMLKIDRSFVQGIGQEPETSLVRASLAMAKALGIGTVAEGVETKGQAVWLHSAGCDHVQGFAYSRPLDVTQVTELLWARAPDNQPSMAAAR